ncbi:hypothetical protein D3C84_796990 [compost metagenome]
MSRKFWIGRSYLSSIRVLSVVSLSTVDASLLSCVSTTRFSTGENTVPAFGLLRGDLLSSISGYLDSTHTYGRFREA